MAAAASSTVRNLLERAHNPDVAEAVFKDKIQYKPLHLRATSPDPTSQDARAQRRQLRLRKREKALRRRPKPKPFSAKEKRISGVHDIPKELQRYEIYVPLNQMWVRYIWDILGLREGPKSFINADMSVVRSKCASLVNLRGLVVKDTKFTFQIITEKDLLKIVPKRDNTFRFEIPQPTSSAESQLPPTADRREKQGPPNLAFEVNGSQFEIRPADRAKKAFKPARVPNI